MKIISGSGSVEIDVGYRNSNSIRQLGDYTVFVTPNEANYVFFISLHMVVGYYFRSSIPEYLPAFSGVYHAMSVGDDHDNEEGILKMRAGPNTTIKVLLGSTYDEPGVGCDYCYESPVTVAYNYVGVSN